MDSAVGICLVAIAIAVLGQGYQSNTLITAMPYCITLLALVIQVGIAGQLTLAFPAFMAVGAFGSGVLSTTYGWPVVGSGLASIALAGALAYVLGRPMTRVRGMALALVTVFLLIIVEQIILASNVLGGTYGLTGVPPLGVGGMTVRSAFAKEVVVGVAFVIVYVVARSISAGAVGRELRLLGHDEESASALGVDVARRKRQLFVFSSLCAALAGVLLVHTQSYVAPSEFAPSIALVMFVMLFFGGRRSLLGAAFGALFFEFLPSWVVPLQNYLLIIEGVVFLAVVLLARDGLAGAVSAGWRRWGRTPWSGGPDQASRPGTAEAGQVGGFRREELRRWMQPTASTGTDEAAAIAARDLSIGFGGLRVLRQVSFQIGGPGVCAIVGPNGAGKTTLFNIIAGQLQPTAGSLSIRGQAHTTHQIGERRALGVVRTFQQVRLVPGLSALDNVALGHIVEAGRKRLVRHRARQELVESRANALAILRMLGCEKLALREAGDITLAEQRLVELARAVCGKGSIYLLDEPASGLSDEQRELLAEAVRTIGLSATVVLVEHDLRFVEQVAERVIALEGGSVIFDGSPSMLSSDEKVVSAYLGLPSQGSS